MKIKFFAVVFLLMTISAALGDQRMEKSSDAPRQSTMYSVYSVVKEGASSIFTPDENPTWKRAFTKASIGVTGLFVSSNITMNNSAEYYAYNALGWTSAGLTLNALSDMAYLIYDSMRRPALERVAFGRSTRRTPQGEKAYDQIIAGRNHELARITRASRLVLNSACTLYFSYTYFQQFMRMFDSSTNPFGLSYPEGTQCTNGDFLCRPITTPAFLTLCASTLAYNLRELSHFTQDSFPERGDIPFFEITNGLIRIGVSALIPKAHGIDITTLNALAHPELYSISIKSAAHKHLTLTELYYVYLDQKNFRPLDRMLYTVIQRSGNLVIYSSLVLVLKNVGSFIWGKAIIRKLERNLPASPQFPVDQRETRKTSQAPYPTP